MSSNPNCWDRFFLKIFDQLEPGGSGINENAADKAAESFIDSFNNPRPILDEVGESIKGFGERTLIFVFIILFIITSIIIWSFVGLGEITWITALLLTVMLLVILIISLFIFRGLIGTYIDIQSKIILDSTEKWIDEEKKKVIPAATRAACVYADNSKC